MEGGSGKDFEADDFYWDERGYRVFTEKYLLKRGYCCKNGCRHCPYSEKLRTNSFKINKTK